MRKMTRLYSERNHWLAAAMVLLFGPVAAMFWLGRARIGLIYLAVEFFLPPAGLIGIPHSYIVARRQAGRQPTAWYSRIHMLIVIFIISALTTGEGMRTLILEPYESPSGSMRPTLAVGDMFAVWKFAYGYSYFSLPFDLPLFEGRIFFRAPERGDIAVFRGPRQPEAIYVKRVVGLPGDRIQVKGGILHINGEPAKRERIEDFELAPNNSTAQYVETLPGGHAHRILEASGDNGVSDNTPEVTVPDGHYFVMGDNRDSSTDSRVFGTVPAQNLVGRVGVVFWNSRESWVTWSFPE